MYIQTVLVAEVSKFLSTGCDNGFTSQADLAKQFDVTLLKGNDLSAKQCKWILPVLSVSIYCYACTVGTKTKLT